jgi:glycosyltransferase involved in cell wall biosynthesis
MVKIVHILYSIESAGSAALRLHKAFIESDIDSSLLSLKSASIQDKKISFLGRLPNLIGKFEYRIQHFLTRNVLKDYGLFTYPVLGTDVTHLEKVNNADIIYLHWMLGGMLNLKIINKLAKLGKPVVFIMHDMWAITGGCHHSFKCNKYISQCVECPAFGSKRKHDLSFYGFRKKEKIYSRYSNLYFVSPSKWLFNCAKQSRLLKDKPLFYIPNAIDNKAFRNIGKELPRRLFGIELNDIVIAFGATSVDSPYKGWFFLIKALEILHHDNRIDNITVLIFGNGSSEEIANSIPFNMKFLGYLRDEYSMILTYNAADVFVSPSLADNQPTTVMESLCCGTPVVGFDVGGIPDMIEHKVNGYLAKYQDAKDLADGIEFCLNKHLRGKILSNFYKDLIIQEHQVMIRSILNTNIK